MGECSKAADAFRRLQAAAAAAGHTIVAVSVGGTVPLLLRRFKMDPALASGPILTTVTDIAGFISFLGTATLLSFML